MPINNITTQPTIESETFTYSSAVAYTNSSKGSSPSYKTHGSGCSVHKTTAPGNLPELNKLTTKDIIHHEDIKSLKLVLNSLVTYWKTGGDETSKSGHSSTNVTISDTITINGSSFKTDEEISPGDWNQVIAVLNVFSQSLSNDSLNTVSNDDEIDKNFYNDIVESYNVIRTSCKCDSNCACNIVCTCNANCGCNYG
jgi:hypothetical protein